jgi:hypothetical protein
MLVPAAARTAFCSRTSLYASPATARAARATASLKLSHFSVVPSKTTLATIVQARSAVLRASCARATHSTAASTMAMSCSVVPPLTPTPAIT